MATSKVYMSRIPKDYQPTVDEVNKYINGIKLYVQGKNLGMLYSSVDFMDLDTGATFFNRGFTVGLQVEF